MMANSGDEDESSGSTSSSTEDSSLAASLAQEEWNRTVREIGSGDEVCEAWRLNGFDGDVMLSAATAALKRSGYESDEDLTEGFVVEYLNIIAAKCGLDGSRSTEVSP